MYQVNNLKRKQFYNLEVTLVLRASVIRHLWSSILICLLVLLEKLVFESHGEEKNIFMHECSVVWTGENFPNFLANESETRFLMPKVFSLNGDKYLFWHRLLSSEEV